MRVKGNSEKECKHRVLSSSRNSDESLVRLKGEVVGREIEKDMYEFLELWGVHLQAIIEMERGRGGGAIAVVGGKKLVLVLGKTIRHQRL